MLETKYSAVTLWSVVWMCLYVCVACLLWVAHKGCSLVGIVIYDDEIITLHTLECQSSQSELYVCMYVCIFGHALFIHMCACLCDVCFNILWVSVMIETPEKWSVVVSVSLNFVHCLCKEIYIMMILQYCVYISLFQKSITLFQTYLWKQCLDLEPLSGSGWLMTES